MQLIPLGLRRKMSHWCVKSILHASNPGSLNNQLTPTERKEYSFIRCIIATLIKVAVNHFLHNLFLHAG